MKRFFFINFSLSVKWQAIIFVILKVDYMDIEYNGNTDYRTADSALVHIVNNGRNDINYTWQNEQCYKCPFFSVTIPSSQNCTQRIQTSYGNVINVQSPTDNTTQVPCRVTFIDYGEYTLNIDEEGKCGVTILYDPPNPDLPVLYAFLFFLGLSILWILLTRLHRRKAFDRLLEPFWNLQRLLTGKTKSQPVNKTQSGDGANNAALNSSDVTNINVTIDDCVQTNGGSETGQVVRSDDDSNQFFDEPIKDETELNTDGEVQSSAQTNQSSPASTNNTGGSATVNGNTSALSSTGVNNSNNRDDVTDQAPPKSQIKARLHFLDAFRGLSLTIMIFVNYGGAGYWYFEHAPWNGLTMADTVFPWFIWMMGTSMIFSFKSLVKKKTPVPAMIWKVVWRSVKLFAIGLSMGTKANNDLSVIRIPGILQRFGLVYLVSGLAYIPCATRANMHDLMVVVLVSWINLYSVFIDTAVLGSKSRMLLVLRSNTNNIGTDHVHLESSNGLVMFRRINLEEVGLLGDVVLFWPEWLIHLILLSVYLALTFALPVPGCPTGYLGPGGMAEGGAYRYCTGGAAGYADRALFTENHIFRYPTPQEIYHTTQAFDPEGFFTVIPSVFLCLLGSQGGLALLLCHGKVDEGWIPINKNLWSLSYIFAMASTGFLLLLIMYILIDVTNIWNGAPFIYPGMNSILIYICHSVFALYFPISWDMPDPTVHWQQLILCCWGTLFWLVVAYILHRKRIYVAL